MENEQNANYLEVFAIPFSFVLLLWLIKYVEWKFNIDLSIYGLYPNKIEGLRGVLFAPLLHFDFYHLLSNTLPIMILGSMMMYFYRAVAFRVFFTIYFLSEAATWFFARPSYHIGASGLVYGLVCFLFFSGIIRRNVKLLGLSLLVTFLYGGIVWGLLPLPIDVSWETHLSGSLTGIGAALLFRRQGPQATRYNWENEDEEFEQTDYSESEIPEQESKSEPPVINYIYKDEETKK